MQEESRLVRRRNTLSYLPWLSFWDDWTKKCSATKIIVNNREKISILSLYELLVKSNYIVKCQYFHFARTDGGKLSAIACTSVKNEGACWPLNNLLYIVSEMIHLKGNIQIVIVRFTSNIHWILFFFINKKYNFCVQVNYVFCMERFQKYHHGIWWLHGKSKMIWVREFFHAFRVLSEHSLSALTNHKDTRRVFQLFL